MGLLNRTKRRAEPTLDLRDEETTIDLRDPAPGGPSTCDACGGSGYLDHIDMRNRVQYEHCTACGAEWSRPVDA